MVTSNADARRSFAHYALWPHHEVFRCAVTITLRSGGASDHNKVIASGFLIHGWGCALLAQKPAWSDRVDLSRWDGTIAVVSIR